MGIREDRPSGGRADQAHADDRHEHLDCRHIGDAAGDLALEAVYLGVQRTNLPTGVKVVAKCNLI